MRLSPFPFLGLLVVAEAAILPNLENLPLYPRKPQNSGPGSGSGNCNFTLWGAVSAELTTLFRMSNGQCNDDARAAIRLTFHDCGTWDTSQGLTGGCDGSLVLTNEIARSENAGLAAIGQKIVGLANKYGVSKADMTVFAGTKAILVCPGGPKIKTFIGRTDVAIPAPEGGLPDVTAAPDVLFNLFSRKGFSAKDLAALLGAHSTSTAFNQGGIGIPVNASQDSTPGQWDVLYYKETLNFAKNGQSPPSGVTPFPSDTKLAVFQDVGKEFAKYVDNQGRWTSDFTDAMQRMVLFGNDQSRMADCTNAL